MSQVLVKLGDHEVTVVPQKIGYLINKVGVDRLAELFDGKGMLEGGYELLALLIPEYGRRVPRWEFEGFQSKEAAEAGQYDEEQDRSPDPDQIIGAFEAVFKVSGGERLKNSFGPEMLRGLLRVAITQMATDSGQPLKPLSPSGDTGSSPTTRPTSARSAESPPPGSSPSPTLEQTAAPAS